MKNKLFLFMLGVLLASCSLKKDKPEALPSVSPRESGGGSGDLNILDSDWDMDERSAGGIRDLLKTLKPSKLAVLRKSFKIPSLQTLTLSESGGFELLKASGFEPLEKTIFIQPKLFISTTTDRGSILGYKTGEQGSGGEDLVTISVPMALVNGLVSSLPLIGGVGTNSAIPLPEKYKISNIAQLQSKLGGDTLSTLPVCPEVFRLIYQGREYRAPSPFKNLSTCPLNQFFRVNFTAPETEMKRLLEAAALQDEAVTVVADMALKFTAPKESHEITIENEVFLNALKATLGSTPHTSVTRTGRPAFSSVQIEEAIMDAVFDQIKKITASPEYTTGLSRFLSEIIDGFFEAPFTCGSGGACRALLERPKLKTSIKYAWVKGESLSTPIETQSVVGLGAVSNQSEFKSDPSWDVLDFGEKPNWFNKKPISLILAECAGLEIQNFPVLAGMDPLEIEYIKGYCKGLKSDQSPTDGYYPLGSNTTVYPGAWLRIDLEEISEFTTAKTRLDEQGNQILESEIVDLLSSESAPQRTSCVEGNQIACEKYALKEIAVRDQSGAQVISDYPCKKGEEGCSCTQIEGKDEVCTLKKYQFQKVMDYKCDQKDEFESCPYYRTQDDVIDFEREWDCQTVKTESHTPFLCIGGCREKNEVICNIRSQKPITSKRQYLNCREDDPRGSANREIMCRRPQYLCEKWQTRCSRYSVNEAFHIVHEKVAPVWRPFSISKGEYPKRFEDQIYLKFVSPKGEVSDCRLDKFGRIFRGYTLFIKIPSEKNEELPCGVPMWNKENSKSLYLPKVFIKNSISYSERRLCGRTEYSFLTQEIPLSNGPSLIPQAFTQSTKVRIGPVAGTCRHQNPLPSNSDLWFTEIPPVRIKGRVSVLGRVLESLVSGGTP